MTNQPQSYHVYRFPPEIISHAVWLYHRFCLSFRDAEDLLAQRGILVTYETIRHWCQTFGPAYAGQLRHRRGRMGDTWFLDALFVKIQAQPQYLWRAIDEDGGELDFQFPGPGHSGSQYSRDCHAHKPSRDNQTLLGRQPAGPDFRCSCNDGPAFDCEHA